MRGTQSPIQTLDRRWGSCRDFAVLFVEAARSLGFGARIVSGDLYQPDQNGVGSAGAGSTDAWAEIFIPGAGWITFDPTNRSVGGFNLIPVAVARDIGAGDAGVRQFRRNGRRLSGHVDRGPRHLAGKRINTAFRQPRRPTCRCRRSEPWPVRPRTSLGRWRAQCLHLLRLLRSRPGKRERQRRA